MVKFKNQPKCVFGVVFIYQKYTIQVHGLLQLFGDGLYTFIKEMYNKLYYLLCTYIIYINMIYYIIYILTINKMY